MNIEHVVVLMLENRSFDSLPGMLYAPGDRFDGLTGIERNTWHKPGGAEQPEVVWTSPDMTPATAAALLPPHGRSPGGIPGGTSVWLATG